LRGLYLGTSNNLCRMYSLSFVPPRGYVQLFAEELSGADQLEFKLPAAGGAIVLYDEAGTELEHVTYGLQQTAVSEGRLPDGAATITTFAGSVSPGASNYVLAWTGPVLNEVLARNQSAVASPWSNYVDFVELFNPGGSAASLAGMALGKSTAAEDCWTFPAGTSIPAGGYLVVWCDGSRAGSTNGSGPFNTGFSCPAKAAMSISSTPPPSRWTWSATATRCRRIHWQHRRELAPAGGANPGRDQSRRRHAGNGERPSLQTNGWLTRPPAMIGSSCITPPPWPLTWADCSSATILP